MQQPEELYELDSAVTPDVSGAAMLVHLEGFMDAGAAGRLVTEHLLDTFEHTTVARFDTDRLLDYRSRRPLMTFDDGHWESYDAAGAVRLLALGRRRASRSCCSPALSRTTSGSCSSRRRRSLAERLGAGPMITYFGVPMGIPHTRPLGVITHATRPGLVTTKVPLPSEAAGARVSAASLMEFRFGEAGRDAIGLVVQVPHYLSQAAYPTAALTLLDAVSEVTGLDLPALELREAADQTNTLIDRQVAESVRGRRAGTRPRAAVRRGARVVRRGEPARRGRGDADRGRARRAVRAVPRRTAAGRRLPGSLIPVTRSPGRVGALFSRSRPVSVQTTMSSMRAPCGPG